MAYMVLVLVIQMHPQKALGPVSQRLPAGLGPMGEDSCESCVASSQSLQSFCCPLVLLRFRHCHAGVRLFRNFR